MWNACKPNLVGIVFLVAEILLLLLSLKMAKFPFQSMDHGGQKIESAQKIQRLMRYMCAPSLVGLASQITFAFLPLNLEIIVNLKLL